MNKLPTNPRPACTGSRAASASSSASRCPDDIFEVSITDFGSAIGIRGGYLIIHDADVNWNRRCLPEFDHGQEPVGMSSCSSAPLCAIPFAPPLGSAPFHYPRKSAFIRGLSVLCFASIRSLPSIASRDGGSIRGPLSLPPGQLFPGSSLRRFNDLCGQISDYPIHTLIPDYRQNPRIPCEMLIHAPLTLCRKNDRLHWDRRQLMNNRSQLLRYAFGIGQVR